MISIDIILSSYRQLQECQCQRQDLPRSPRLSIGYDWIGCPILMTSLTSPWEVLVAKPSFSTFNVLRRHKKVCYRTSGRQELHWQPRTSNVTESNRIDGVIVASLLGVHTESTCRETNAKASLHSHNICKANQGLNGFGQSSATSQVRTQNGHSQTSLALSQTVIGPSACRLQSS